MAKNFSDYDDLSVNPKKDIKKAQKLLEKIKEEIATKKIKENIKYLKQGESPSWTKLLEEIQHKKDNINK